RSSQRALGSARGELRCPVVSHCSLDAACAERPRPTAPGSTQRVLVTAHGSRHGPRGAKRRPGAPNKPAGRTRSAGAARPCCWLLTVSGSVAGGGASG
ncbi:MAG TPA: hypothetical protein VFW03_28770, partial [Gemmatimonadaceae bacterium]|nr:hypothetical protein [Gemmatimonadaceae bacterium]